MIASPMNLSSIPPCCWMQSTMIVKYSFSSATVACGPSSSASVVKLRMSENSTVASTLLPPRISWSPAHQLVGERGIHVARHRGAHALLAADVLHHDHRAEMAAVGPDERQHRHVDRDTGRGRRRHSASTSRETSTSIASSGSRDLAVRDAGHQRADDRVGVAEDLRAAAGRRATSGSVPRMRAPPSLQVAIVPPLSRVMTPFDMLASIASL